MKTSVNACIQTPLLIFYYADSLDELLNLFLSSSHHLTKYRSIQLYPSRTVVHRTLLVMKSQLVSIYKVVVVF